MSSGYIVALIAAGGTLGGALMAAGVALYTLFFNRRAAKRDRETEERAAVNAARIDDLAEWRRELVARIDKQDEKIEKLQGENIKLQREVGSLEVRNKHLEELMVDIARRLEALASGSLENLSFVKSELEALLADLREVVQLPARESQQALEAPQAPKEV